MPSRQGIFLTWLGLLVASHILSCSICWLAGTFSIWKKSHWSLSEARDSLYSSSAVTLRRLLTIKIRLPKMSVRTIAKLTWNLLSSLGVYNQFWVQLQAQELISLEELWFHLILERRHHYHWWWDTLTQFCWQPYFHQHQTDLSSSLCSRKATAWDEDTCEGGILASWCPMCVKSEIVHMVIVTFTASLFCKITGFVMVKDKPNFRSHSQIRTD